MAMIIVENMKVKENDGLRGRMAEKRLSPDILNIPAISIKDDRVYAAFQASVLEAIQSKTDQIKAIYMSAYAEEDQDLAERRFDRANEISVALWKWDQGAAWSQVRKEELISEGVLTAEDFEPLKKGKTGSPKIEVGGEIEL